MRAWISAIAPDHRAALELKALVLVTTLIDATGLCVAILGGTALVTLNALRLLGYFRGDVEAPATASPESGRPALATG